MKKLILLILFCSCVGLSQSGRGSTYYEFDSTTVVIMTDSVPTPLAGKFRMFFAVGTDNIVHPYKMNHLRQVTRLDSSGTGGSGTSKRISPFGWYTWATVADSQIVFEVDTTYTLDSIRVIQRGASAISFMATRTRAGVTVDLLTANYAVTTSMTKATTIQNGTFQASDVIRAVIRSITGTTTEFFVQFYWH